MYTTTQVVCEKTSSTTLVTLSFIIPTYQLILICIYCLYTLYPLITLPVYTLIHASKVRLGMLLGNSCTCKVINKETKYLT